MDNGQGRFLYNDETDPGAIEIQKSLMEIANPNHGGWFRIGEEIEIKGSLFRVKAITPTQLRLKLIRRKGEIK